MHLKRKRKRRVGDGCVCVCVVVCDCVLGCLIFLFVVWRRWFPSARGLAGRRVVFDVIDCSVVCFHVRFEKITWPPTLAPTRPIIDPPPTRDIIVCTFGCTMTCLGFCTKGAARGALDLTPCARGFFSPPLPPPPPFGFLSLLLIISSRGLSRRSAIFARLRKQPCLGVV